MFFLGLSYYGEVLAESSGRGLVHFCLLALLRVTGLLGSFFLSLWFGLPSPPAYFSVSFKQKTRGVLTWPLLTDLGSFEFGAADSSSYFLLALPNFSPASTVIPGVMITLKDWGH